MSCDFLNGFFSAGSTPNSQLQCSILSSGYRLSSVPHILPVSIKVSSRFPGSPPSKKIWWHWIGPMCERSVCAFMLRDGSLSHPGCAPLWLFRDWSRIHWNSWLGLSSHYLMHDKCKVFFFSWELKRYYILHICTISVISVCGIETKEKLNLLITFQYLWNNDSLRTIGYFTQWNCFTTINI